MTNTSALHYYVEFYENGKTTTEELIFYSASSALREIKEIAKKRNSLYKILDVIFR